MRTAIKGIPEHWIPAIAQQCVHAPIQQTGRRSAPSVRDRPHQQRRPALHACLRTSSACPLPCWEAGRPRGLDPTLCAAECSARSCTPSRASSCWATLRMRCARSQGRPDLVSGAQIGPASHSTARLPLLQARLHCLVYLGRHGRRQVQRVGGTHALAAPAGDASHRPGRQLSAGGLRGAGPHPRVHRCCSVDPEPQRGCLHTHISAEAAAPVEQARVQGMTWQLRQRPGHAGGCRMRTACPT